MQWAPLISAVQRLTPPHLHGRVMGALESLGALCPALGLPLGGALVALSSPRTAFLVVGVGAALTTIGFVRIPINEKVAADRPQRTRPPTAPSCRSSSPPVRPERPHAGDGSRLLAISRLTSALAGAPRARLPL